MSLSCDPTRCDPNNCGCCLGPAIQTPVAVHNRPGLSALSRRIGTHSRFKSSMLARLSLSEHPALHGLRTRQDDDLSIALLDAWAAVADVLTFYQERIANECYLRTATERRSLRYLSELTGYKLHPGVAAETHLAFTIEEAKGAPAQTHIAAGTRVQSIPGPDELPQIYETVEAIDARPEWNEMRPLLAQAQTLAHVNDTHVATVKGVTTSIKPGDKLLLVTGEGGATKEVQLVVKVVPDPEAQTTRIEMEDAQPKLPSFKPWWVGRGTFFTAATRLTNNVVTNSFVKTTWNQANVVALAAVQKWPILTLMSNLKARAAHREPIEETGLFALRRRAAIFGHNAPEYDQPTHGGTTWEGRTLEDENTTRGVSNTVYLDNAYPEILAGSYVVLDSPTTGPEYYTVQSNVEVSRSNFALTAKVSSLTLDHQDGFETFMLRDTTVFGQSERLELADLPIEDPVQGSSVLLDRAYLGLRVGQTVIVTGEPTDLEAATVSETRTLVEIKLSGGHTELYFDRALDRSYVRTKVSINANVARATHGERVLDEVLGHGEALRPFQRFALRKPFLTHVSASTASGTATTLEVRVNDLLWREVSSLYEHGPDEQVYTTYDDEDGKTVVQFGDGRNGARLPTGQENVRATYRAGIGEQGLVQADQLSLLMTRPLGVRGVTNPVAARGAADGETLAEVRENAPLAILTLDRIVSLQDYEDFCRAFGGIAKALATWTWDGRQSGVFVTVAGPKGAAVDEGGTVYKNLLAAMRGAGDPSVPLRVRSYRSAYFLLQGSVKLDPQHVWDQVLAAAEKALREAFGFEARAFGQPVTSSEVIAVLQGVKGVVAVDLDLLHRVGDAVALEPRLVAERPHAGATDALAAELLTLDPRPIKLGVMS